MMADGSLKQICKIQIGEKLKSINNEINTVISLEKTKLGNRKLASINNSEFFFSHDHPVLTKDGFKSFDYKLSQVLYSDIYFIGNLQVGDIIYVNQEEQIVTQLETKYASPDLELYDLSLDGNHIHIINNIAFHNCTIASWCCIDSNGAQCSLLYPIECETGPFVVASCESCNTTTTTTTTSTTEVPCPCPYSNCGCPHGPYIDCAPGEYFSCDLCQCIPNEITGCCLSYPNTPGCVDMAPAICDALNGIVLSASCVDSGPNPCGTTTTTTTEPSTEPPTTTTTTTTATPQVYYCIECFPDLSVSCISVDVGDTPGPFYDCYVAGGPYPSPEDCAANCVPGITTTTTTEIPTSPPTSPPTLDPGSFTTTTTTTTTENPDPIGCCTFCDELGNLYIIDDTTQSACLDNPLNYPNIQWSSTPCALFDPPPCPGGETSTTTTTTTNMPTSPPW
jgi:hypothetical protein